MDARVGPSPAADHVRVALEDGVLSLVLDRDPKRNAVSQDMLRTLTAAVREAAVDPSVRAVLLRGEGRDFCAGEDVSGFDFPDAATAQVFLEGPTQFFEELELLPKPVCVAVHGHALGFGSEVLLAADVVIAHPDAILGFAEIDHGAVPAVLLTRGLGTTGRRRALLLALTGRRIGVADAVAAGLVHLVDERPAEAALAWALRMASWEPGSAALVKRVLAGDVADDHDMARDVMPAILQQTRAAI